LTAAGLASTRVAARFVSCLRAACAGRPLHDSDLENNATAALTSVTTGGPEGKLGCHPSYPTVCIPPPPPDLNCADIPFRNFRVLRDIPDADPHDLDGTHDGVGCTFDDY
jgi:micrococcal nuclease